MAVLYSQSWAAGSSDFCDPGHVEPNGTDPLYPEIRAAETVKVTVGVGPSGENVVETDLAGPANPYAVSGVWASYQSWALNDFDITVKWKPLAAALNESGNFCDLFQLIHNILNPVFRLAYDTNIEQFLLYVDGAWRSGPVVSKASLQDQWQTFRICGSNSTNNGFGPADGSIKAFRNGSVMSGLDLTGLYVVMGGGTSPVATGYRVGYFGMIGQVTGISIADDPCEAFEEDAFRVNNSVPCCDDGTTPGGTSTGPILPPDPNAPLPPWIASCTAGGLAPDGTDPTFSESWLVL